MKIVTVIPGIALSLAWCLSAGADLSGRIVDASGAGLANARVFAEPGVEKAVIEGSVSPDGSFTIPGEFFGNVGVFAFAPSLSVGGVHLNIAAGEAVAPFDLRLGEDTSLSGRVVDEKGDPVSGARIVSLAITQPTKVGIPLSKMTSMGVAVPVSAEDGAFQIPGIPGNSRIALKFEHAFYAQEAVMDIPSGSTGLRVVMHRGVSLRGTVAVRGTDKPVSNALVVARNTQPPHDSASAGTDGTGSFRMLLKPGVYLVQAYSIGRVSPGLQRVELTGELPEQQVRLNLSETGTIAGTVHDAKSGEPIPGVRVFLETQGQVGGIARTGPQGDFRLSAPEGANSIRLEPVKGFQPPGQGDTLAMVPAGGVLELPGFWLAPVPEYRLRVVEEDGETPVSGAFVSLLQPRQFGWQRADAAGLAVLQFGALPPDGRLIGLVEHPGKDRGALFALTAQHAADASVALLPLAEVTGRVVNAKGNAMPGVMVGAVFADDASPEPVALWRVVTDARGRFEWTAAPAGVPQRCAAALGAVHATAARDVNPAPGETVDLGDIILQTDKEPASPGPEAWMELPHIGGPPALVEKNAGLVAFCCNAQDASLYLEAVPSIRAQLAEFNVEALLAVSGDLVVADAQVPMYRAPAQEAVTRLYCHGGRLLLETPGLPPLSAVRALGRE